MNREIKFRAFYDGTRKMIYFPICSICDEYSSFSFYAEEDSIYDGIGRLPNYPYNDGNGDDGWRKNWTLMQFTGLTDKNDKEIFEGDIVFYEDYKWIVVYDYDRFDMQDPKNKDHFVRSDDFSDDPGFTFWEKSEVIGNIYENPELIKLE